MKLARKASAARIWQGAGERAEARFKEAGYKGTAGNGAEYLVESLHEPVVYVVEGYQPSMPPLGRQLSDLEMVAIVAFLQSLGGEVTREWADALSEVARRGWVRLWRPQRHRRQRRGLGGDVWARTGATVGLCYVP